MMFDLTIANQSENELAYGGRIIGNYQAQPAPVTPDIPGNGTGRIQIRLKNAATANAQADSVVIFYKRQEPGGVRSYSIGIDRAQSSTIPIRRVFADGMTGLNQGGGMVPASTQGFHHYFTAGGNGPLRQAIAAKLIHPGKFTYSFLI